MKALPIITLSTALLTACVPIAATVVTYKTSQAINHISGGQDGLTLTEQSYQTCKNKNERCFEKGVYSAVFFPVDTVVTVMTGEPQLVGHSHGAIWHEVDKKLPVISKVQPSYGGHNYNQFIQKRK